MFNWFKKTPQAPAPSKFSTDIWLMHADKSDEEDFSSQGWNGIAVYHNAIVLKGGSGVIVIDGNGISTNQDVIAFKQL